MKDVTELPFNRFIGLELSPGQPDRLLILPAAPQYLNHVGTVHASALYSLAEASSGHFLASHLKLPNDSILPLLRKGEIKYRKPASGEVFSLGVHDSASWTAFHSTYERKRRAIISFVIELHTEAEGLVARGDFDWFITEKVSSKTSPDSDRS